MWGNSLKCYSPSRNIYVGLLIAVHNPIMHSSWQFECVDCLIQNIVFELISGEIM